MSGIEEPADRAAGRAFELEIELGRGGGGGGGTNGSVGIAGVGGTFVSLPKTDPFAVLVGAVRSEDPASFGGEELLSPTAVGC